MRTGVPEAPLAVLARHTGTELSNLMAARTRTEEALERMRARVAAILPEDHHGSVVLLGSWGRRELTAGSDDDWLLLRTGPADDQHAARVAQELRSVLGGGSRRPGTQQVFEAPVSCDDLVGHIGLADDDNRNLTRRMLLLLESVPVAGEAVWEHCWLRVLDGYLDEPLRAGSPPRFLLNDIMRYWRTMLVDFVGKTRGRDDGKTVLRDLKLRTSRKVLYSGGLLPALRSAELPPDQMRSFLREQLALPATDRLADAFMAYDAAPAGARALRAYDAWVGMLADTDSRGALTELQAAAAERSELYARGRALACELQEALEELLFDTGLQRLVRHHAVL